VAAFVVRHAKAGDREAWEGDDRLRPLTKSGRRQAEGLVEVLKGQPIDRILSSGYVRCRETVEPLAEARHLPAESTAELEEGAGGDSVLRLVKRFKGKNVVLCTHGDVVEELLEHLMARGVVSRAQASNEKGGTWVLEERSGEVSGASYRPAP
jgi:phosphohistidine phosphatase SixA